MASKLGPIRVPGMGSMETLKVSTKSNPNSVAGAMAGVVRQSGAVEVQVVGAGALNQAIKAVAIARGYLTDAGIDLVCIPSFADIAIDGERRTAIRLSIEDRGRQPVRAVDGVDGVHGRAAPPSSPAASAQTAPVFQGLAEITTSAPGSLVSDDACSSTGAGAVRGAGP